MAIHWRVRCSCKTRRPHCRKKCRDGKRRVGEWCARVVGGGLRVVVVSGRGTTLEAIVDGMGRRLLDALLAGVISKGGGAPGGERGGRGAPPAVFLEPRGRANF